MGLAGWMTLCPILMVVGCTTSTTMTEDQTDTTSDTQSDTTPDDSSLATTGTIIVALPSDSAGGAFARLNPDSGYMAELTGERSSEFPDNEPNETISYPGIEDMLMPESVNGTIVDSTTTVTAAIMEMADRTQGTFEFDASSTPLVSLQPYVAPAMGRTPLDSCEAALPKSRRDG